MRLSTLEIDRIDWDSYECGCGRPAGHLATDLRNLISANTEEKIRRVDFEGHVEHGTIIFEVTPVAITVMVAALSEELHPEARHKLHTTILRSISGEGEEMVNGTPVGACASAARAGLWQLYKDAAEGFGVAALIVNIIGGERARLEYFISRLEDPPEWVGNWNKLNHK
ncbi:hypothetical protein [Kitasatospora sp. MMS16-BH015]|uniref:hypothetical protein n=1 Tax=Kitasatospora sp. MMS16-BH015 TaxID=2018025 RepID=UPI00131A5AFC|nr:hypothetical protein [Kitasatospora sp. MMS16-BH015]